MGKKNKFTASHGKEVEWSTLLEVKVYDVCFNYIPIPEPPAPKNVVVVRFDSTSIGVSWTKFTLVELKGLANYIVTYNIIIGSRKRQLGGTITVPWTQNQVIISDLQPGAEYDVTVTTSSTAGMSGNASITKLMHSRWLAICIFCSSCGSWWHQCINNHPTTTYSSSSS